MTWLNSAMLIASTLLLFGIDVLIGISGTLYMPPIAGFGLLAFIVAVPLLIAFGQVKLLFIQHNVALGYFLIRGVRDGSLDGLREFIGFVIVINSLLALTLWSRGRVITSLKRGTGAALGAVLAASMSYAGPAIAHDAGERGLDCLVHMPDQPTLARFAVRPVARDRVRAPAPPVLASRDSRLFRSVLRKGAAAGPNFAGHFTIVAWGCGASCTSAAIVDARNGRVTMPPILQAISAVHVAEAAGPNGFNSLGFRLDSRLLVVLGAPGEDKERDGAAMLEWDGTALRLLRFIPRNKRCTG